MFNQVFVGISIVSLGFGAFCLLSLVRCRRRFADMAADLQRQLDLLHSELPQCSDPFDSYMKSRDCSGGNPFNLRWELRHVFKYSLLGVNADDSALVTANPHAYDLMYSTDKDFFCPHLEKIFPDGQSGLTAREIVLRVVRYTTEMLRLGPEAPGPVLTKYIVKGGTALCGGRSTVAKEFLRHLGYPTRVIFMLCSEATHADIEVFFNGSWHFISSLSGLYFCWPDGDPSRMLSFSEWVNSGDQVCGVAFASKVFSGEPDTGPLRCAVFTKATSKPILEQFLADNDHKSDIIAQYQMYYSDSRPILAYVATPKSLVPCPLNLDFVVHASIRIGAVDNTAEDVVCGGIADVASRSSPFAVGQNVTNTYLLSVIAKSAGPGYMRLRIHVLTEEMPELSITMLQNARLLSVKREGRKATLDVRLMERTGAFLVTAWQYARLGAIEADFSTAILPDQSASAL